MKGIYILAILWIVAGCKDGKKNGVFVADKTTETNVTTLEHPGKKIMETECYVCHTPYTPEDSRIAPPMIAIKRRYINAETTKEQFQTDLVNWINSPSEEKSKMPGALERFGIMPYQPFPEEEIKLIAEYLFDHEIEKPEWFEAHYQQEHGQGQGMGRGQGMGKGQGMGRGMGMGRDMGSRMGQNGTETDYSALGLKYALSTKAQLGKNLLLAINQKGTVGAVEFCNLRAITLTDSMAISHKVKIKRVSDKPRNPDNMANAKELAYIATFKELVESGPDIEPMTEEINGQVHFYYPITTNTMCLQCHGKPNEQVTPETLGILKSLYPKDQALGYDVNQVRGIWSIVLEQ
jgi:cytochrome c553